MPSFRPRSVLVASCVGLPVLLVAGITLTEPPLYRGSAPPAPGEVVGVLHVHTLVSDGGGTVEEVLAAARSDGLDFVLLTDHNLRGAPAWVYRDSVLLIVGEEVNTAHGHLVVAGMEPIGDRRQKGPESGGRPSVRPDEGLRIAAHPTGRPPWTGWEGEEFDGIEIWNADTERRGDGIMDWMHAVTLLPFRPMAALYRLLDHPREELALWDRLLEERAVFGVCAVDAHHTLPLNASGTLDLHFPAYRHSFAMARQHVLLQSDPTGEPRTDGRALLAALARGRSYCAFDGLADARGSRFTVTAGPGSGTLGDSVAWSPGARLAVHLPPEVDGERLEAEVRVVRDGTVLKRWDHPDQTDVELPGPGVYRVEVMVKRGRKGVPWILTNPIWVTASPEDP